MHSDPDPEAHDSGPDEIRAADTTDRPETPDFVEAHFVRRSDPQQRHNIYLWLGGMALFAVLLFGFGLPWLKRWINTGNIDDVLRKMAWVFEGLGLLMLVMAAYAGSFARRIFRSGEFPPPGMWVLRDTPIKHGDAARARGWWVIACAVCFVLLAMYVAILPARLHGLLASPGPSGLHAPAHR